jgi:hypothetical protein
MQTSEAKISELEKRLNGLEAKEQIRELLHRYGFAADTGDAKAWSEVWNEHAVYERGGETVISGRAAFFTAIEDPHGTHKVEIENRGSLHSINPVTVEVNGDRAWAEGSTLVWVCRDRGYDVYTLSHNHWDFAKTRDKWEIVRRISRPVGPGTAKLVYTNWRA